ncbi:MAG: threonine/serine exporter family protein [Filifactoraceae bacterium]
MYLSFFVKHFLLSFISSMGFAVMFRVRKKSLLLCGLTGAIGWFTYKLLSESGINLIFSNLIAAIVVSSLSEWFARVQKLPVTCFVLPGIFLLVPGYGIYLTMQYLIQDQYSTGISKGIETLFVSGAIAVGIILVSSISKSLKALSTSIKKSNSLS